MVSCIARVSCSVVRLALLATCILVISFKKLTSSRAYIKFISTVFLLLSEDGIAKLSR
jgi:hypothetical protein